MVPNNRTELYISSGNDVVLADESNDVSIRQALSSIGCYHIILVGHRSMGSNDLPDKLYYGR